MIDSKTDVLIPITAPSLTSDMYGENINQVFDNIWKNFQTIINLDYIKGAQGDSIITKVVSLNEISDINNTKSWGDLIINALKAEYNDSTSGNIIYDNTEITCFSYLYDGSNNFNKNIKLTLIYKKDNNNGVEELVSSLPFIFLDKRFNHKIITDVTETNPAQYKGKEDCSCIISVENGDLKIIKTYPTLYFDTDKGNFCWKINSVESGLIAKGPMGKTGRAGKCHVVKCEEIIKDNQMIYEKLSVLCNNESGNEWVKISKETAEKYDVKSGDLVFVLANNYNTINDDAYDFYISNILFNENKQSYYTIISDNSIYTQFLTINFKKFLSNINISNSSDDFLRGLYIPICPGKSDKEQYNHMFCATPTMNDAVGGDVFSENINFNIIPTSDSDGVNTETVRVQRSSYIYKYIDEDKIIHNSTDDIPNYVFLITYDSKHKDLSTLNAVFGMDNDSWIRLLKYVYGNGYYNIDEDTIKDKLKNEPVYLWKYSNNEYYISNNLNIYNNPKTLIYKCERNTQNSNINNLLCKVYKNNSYIYNETLDEVYRDNTSLNFGYNSVYFGTKTDDDKTPDVNVNINGNLHASNIYNNNANINYADIDNLYTKTINNRDSISSKSVATDLVDSIKINTTNLKSNDISSENIINKNDISTSNISVSNMINAGIVNVKNTENNTTIDPDGINTTEISTHDIIAGQGQIYNFFAGPNVSGGSSESSSSKTYNARYPKYRRNVTKTNLAYKWDIQDVLKGVVFLDIKASNYGAKTICIDNIPIFALRLVYNTQLNNGSGGNFNYYSGRIITEIVDEDGKTSKFYTKGQKSGWPLYGITKTHTETMTLTYGEDIQKISNFNNKSIKSLKIYMSGEADSNNSYYTYPFFDGNGFGSSCYGSYSICVGALLNNHSYNGTTLDEIFAADGSYFNITYEKSAINPGSTEGYPKLFLNDDSFKIQLSENKTITFDLKDEKSRIIINGYVITGEKFHDGII